MKASTVLNSNLQGNVFFFCFFKRKEIKAKWPKRLKGFSERVFLSDSMEKNYKSETLIVFNYFIYG